MHTEFSALRSIVVANWEETIKVGLNAVKDSIVVNIFIDILAPFN